MWTKTKSLVLSRILVTAFTALIVMLGAFVPFFADWFAEISDGVGLLGGMNIVLPVCAGLYVCEAFALAAMAALHILLRNIARDEVFVVQNTKCLRAISWDCMLAGCVFFVLGLWRILFWLPAFFIVMFGLILRVLKNVFEQAVEIKTENDFTV